MHMHRILSLIDNVESSLSRYLDEKCESKDGENKWSTLDSGVNKADMQNACAILRAKFEMLCHSVGICTLDKKQVGRSFEEYTIDIPISINESESYGVRLSPDPFSRSNVICNFYNMVNVSASLRDAIVKLIVSTYGEEVKARAKAHGENKINLNNVTSIQLTKILGENCLLGAVMSNYASQSEAYKRIITLRNYLVHHNVTGVLSADYIHPNSAPKVESAWTPTGTAMVLQDYAKFVYRTSTDLVTRICKCIAEKPAGCIEARGKNSWSNTNASD